MSQLDKCLLDCFLEQPTTVRTANLRCAFWPPIILLLGHVVFKEPQTLCETYRPV